MLSLPPTIWGSNNNVIGEERNELIAIMGVQKVEWEWGVTTHLNVQMPTGATANWQARKRMIVNSDCCSCAVHRWQLLNWALDGSRARLRRAHNGNGVWFRRRTACCCGGTGCWKVGSQWSHWGVKVTEIWLTFLEGFTPQPPNVEFDGKNTTTLENQYYIWDFRLFFIIHEFCRIFWALCFFSFKRFW
jgi:hypothetical protein